jgi:hypothetical protein
MVWQLAEKRAADLADARRALVEAETTIGQLEAYLGAVRQINVRLNAQAARARRQASALVEHLGHAMPIVEAARAYAKAYNAYLNDPDVLRDELRLLERAIVAAVDAAPTADVGGGA